jgi:hypothetical protein
MTNNWWNILMAKMMRQNKTHEHVFSSFNLKIWIKFHKILKIEIEFPRISHYWDLFGGKNHPVFTTPILNFSISFLTDCAQNHGVQPAAETWTKIWIILKLKWNSLVGRAEIPWHNFLTPCEMPKIPLKSSRTEIVIKSPLTILENPKTKTCYQKRSNSNSSGTWKFKINLSRIFCLFEKFNPLSYPPNFR